MSAATIPFRDKSPIAGQHIETWPQLKLTPAQRQLWDETRTAVLWNQPAFSDVWYTMMLDRQGTLCWFTDRIPTAATDDKFMYINPATFFEYLLEQRVFICLHEILHCIFNHCGMFWRWKLDGEIRYSDGLVLPFVSEVMQIAADCVINAILIEGKCGEAPPDCWHMPAKIKGSIGIDEAYRILYKMMKGKGKHNQAPKNGSKSGQGQSFDEHLQPGQGRGKSPTEAESERDPQQWINAVNAAMDSARLAGKLPLNLERLFCSTMEVKTDWRELLALNLAKAIGRDGHSWQYLDNEMALRGVGFPSRVRNGCNHVTVIADTSGSIDQKTMDYFMSHLRAMIDQANPKRITFAQVDATIHSWDDVDSVDELDGKVRGGGGTNFCPPFARVEEEGDSPDVLVYLTDLEGPMPDAPPSYPVIWACINQKKAAWGSTVHIPPMANEEELRSY